MMSTLTPMELMYIAIFCKLVSLLTCFNSFSLYIPARTLHIIWKMISIVLPRFCIQMYDDASELPPSTIGCPMQSLTITPMVIRPMAVFFVLVTPALKCICHINVVITNLELEITRYNVGLFLDRFRNMRLLYIAYSTATGRYFTANCFDRSCDGIDDSLLYFGDCLM